MGPQVESDRRKVRIDFEAGRATSRSASGLFRFFYNASNALKNAAEVHSALAASSVGSFKFSVRGCVVQNNPYLPSRMESGKAKQQRKGSVVVKCLAAISVLVCVLLILLMIWAWWLYWSHQRVPQGVSSFPYRAFAVEATQAAVVGCAIVLSLWFAFGVICWSKKRAVET